MKEYIENPLHDTLYAIMEEKLPLPLKGVFNTSELSETDYDILQQWCLNNSRPFWSTGIGMMDAADIIVYEAVNNGNIQGKP